MQCHQCETTNPEDNAFCEECGTRIGGEAAPAVEACVCGTPLSEMDEDGFCTGCGRRLKRPDSDHIEIEVSPDFAGVCDRGLRHSRNEDRFALARIADGYALVVCDGVSMSPDADAAAAAAVEAAMANLGDVRTAVHAAAEAVKKLAEGKSDAPSTTIVVALVQGSQLTVGWLGDSRAYWITGQEAIQITRDHSWLNTPAGQQEGAQGNPHALTRWLGPDADDLEPEIAEQELKTSGILLLCSDGLWNYAEESGDMAPLVTSVNSPGESALNMARALVEFAKSKGGHDNITAAILRNPVSEEETHGG